MMTISYESLEAILGIGSAPTFLRAGTTGAAALGAACAYDLEDEATQLLKTIC